MYTHRDNILNGRRSFAAPEKRKKRRVMISSHRVLVRQEPEERSHSPCVDQSRVKLWCCGHDRETFDRRIQFHLTNGRKGNSYGQQMRGRFTIMTFLPTRMSPWRPELRLSRKKRIANRRSCLNPFLSYLCATAASRSFFQRCFANAQVVDTASATSPCLWSHDTHNHLIIAGTPIRA